MSKTTNIPLVYETLDGAQKALASAHESIQKGNLLHLNKFERCLQEIYIMHEETYTDIVKTDKYIQFIEKSGRFVIAIGNAKADAIAASQKDKNPMKKSEIRELDRLLQMVPQDARGRMVLSNILHKKPHLLKPI